MATRTVQIQNVRYEFTGTEKNGDITPLPVHKMSGGLPYIDRAAIGRYDIQWGHELNFDVVVPPNLVAA